MNYGTLAILALSLLLCASADRASAAYLNDTNMTVALGVSMSAEPFSNRTTADSLASIIDAPTAASSEFHNQSTHVWVSGGQLELDFDLQQEYNLTTLHFWNYYGESFDVDTIDLLFFDASHALVGTQPGIAPLLGGPGNSDSTPINAEDIDISANAQGVRFVNAVLSGSNSQVDFNNLGFSGDLVPEPSTSIMLLTAAGTLMMRRRKPVQCEGTHT